MFSQIEIEDEQPTILEVEGGWYTAGEAAQSLARNNGREQVVPSYVVFSLTNKKTSFKNCQSKTVTLSTEIGPL